MLFAVTIKENESSTPADQITANCTDPFVYNNDQNFAAGISDNAVLYVAQVGTEQYQTLQAAIDAADGKTVTLLANIKLASRVDVKNTVTLDLNSFDIDAEFDDPYGMIYVGKTGNLTVTDSKQDGVIANMGEGTLIGNYGTVTIENGQFACNGDTSIAATLYNFYADGSTYGKATIKDGLFNGCIWNCGKL